MEIPEPVEVQDNGNGLEVDLGTLAFGANPGPGAYQAISSESCIEGTSIGDIGGSSSLTSMLNTSEVPTVSFSISILANGNASDSISDLIASAVRSMLGTSAIANVDFVSTDGLLRRLSSEQTLTVSLKYMSMEEASDAVQDVDLDVTSDAILEVLRQDEALGIQSVRAFDASLSVVPLTCLANAFVPPGVTIRDVGDCVCGTGYEYFGTSCTPCTEGQYKATIGNENCNSCPVGKTTLKIGSTSLQDCLCQAGTFEHEGECSDCQKGFFCPGTGKAEKCPENTLSPGTGARTNDSCLCIAGYYLNGKTCEPCPRGRFKGNLGNEPCTQLCPANADSYPAATSSYDCFCTKDHHAILVSSGQLDRCASCASYVGLVCLGGFDDSKEHVQPKAEVGFYQTGTTSASKCRVFLADGSSACLGQNQCAEGTTGTLCGECPLGWARSTDFTPCDACVEGSATGLLSATILYEVTEIAATNFVLAALAAISSAITNLRLHTCMIRVFTQWFAACNLITLFNLEVLELPFTQPVTTSAATDVCNEQKPQEPVDSPLDPANVTDERKQDDTGVVGTNLRFSWPPAVSRAMATLISLIARLPRFASLKFSAQCRAFELSPGGPEAQRLAPALYFVCLPILTILATCILCAVAVYVLVPLGERFGVYFNRVAKVKGVKRKQLAKVFGSCMAKIPLSHVPRDLPKCRDMDKFIDDICQKYESFAKELCWMKCKEEPQFAALLQQLGPRICLKCLACPEQHLRTRTFPAGSAQATKESKSLRKLRSFSICKLPPTDGQHIAAAEDSGDKLSQVAVQLNEHDAFSVPPNLQDLDQEMDADSLDFGLFTSKPGLKALFKQTLPVIWPTLIAIWPRLLSEFLSLTWCTPVNEDGCVRERLVPHPDVVCFSNDHLPTFLIAVIGLTIWCVGIPGCLFTVIYCLGKKRQELESRRKYGLFIRGLEPEMWWWDLVVKRADIALMMLVAYTSVIGDETAKIFVFAFISGVALCLTTWLKPYSNNQGEILDLLEMGLLTTRFVLYFGVAMMLIVVPTPTAIRIFASSLLVMLCAISAVTVLHIIAQFLRIQSRQEDEERHLQVFNCFIPCAGIHSCAEETAEGAIVKQLAGTLKGLKQGVLDTVLPFFQEDEDERWALTWSPGSQPSSHSGRKSVRESLDLAWPEVQGRSGRLQPVVKKARALFLRFGTSVQRLSVVQAYQEFYALWLEVMQENCIPNVGTLCALVASHQALPTKGDVGEAWIKAAQKVLEDPEREFELVGHDFTETVHRLSD
eukprot:Skav224004  [mRNA]  locus=scaffold2619:51010:57912:- [translate_table: standard]